MATMKQALSLRLIIIWLVLTKATANSGSAAASKVSESSNDAAGGGGPAGVGNDFIDKAKQALLDMYQATTLAGTPEPATRRLFSHSRHDLLQTWNIVKSAAHWEDVALYVLIGWFTVPALFLPYYGLLPARTDRRYIKSKLYLIADHIQQLARIALLVYIVDILKMFCIGMGYEFCKMQQIPHAFCQGAYVVWFSNRLHRLKQWSIHRYVNYHPDMYGRMKLVSRLVDAGIYGLMALLLLGILKVELGVTMSGILALGSVGTLTLGLASRDIAAQLVNGLMLASSDRLYEGDSVRLGNGGSGTIIKLGWLETVIRGSDEVMMNVPNTDLLKQNVCNLSRVRNCQVKQSLRFKYSSANKLPALIQSIKDEIRLACSELITDSSRPFRVHWTSYEFDHLEVVVDAHFRIRPTGDEYWDNRQRVMQAIDRAVKINQVEFAIPPAASYYNNK